MNLGDPELELIDPTPNVHSLFLHFDKVFFWTKLASRAVVRWSKRMYSCAGVCSYEGRGGLCDIALSEPLLKLRPRKNLIETLLHEMIHAYLFITCQDRERDGHGPNFKAHMHRINRSAGLNITIYHDFHDEVELYLTHWWRCDGPCQKKKPYFGVVRRSMNKPPGPSDNWWNYHQKHCGGTFIKIKEPEKKTNKKQAAKPKAAITKYINNNNNTKDKNIKTINDINNVRKPLTPILKTSSNIPAASIKSNGGKTIVISPNIKKGVTFEPNKDLKSTGKGQILNGRQRANSVDVVVETVREVWLKKYANTNSNGLTRNNSMTGTNNANKHKANAVDSDSPANKIRKIDDYFKKAATSVLNDLYGGDFKIVEEKNSDKKIVVVPAKTNSTPVKNNLVPCPVCNTRIDEKDINKHLDECLNKEVLEKLSKESGNGDVKPVISNQLQNKTINEIKASNFVIPPFKPKVENAIPKCETKDAFSSSNVSIDLTNVAFGNLSHIKKEPNVKKEAAEVITFDPSDVNKVKSIVKKIQFDKHIRRSGNFIVEETPVKTDVGYLPSFLDDKATEIVLPPIKTEPGTSKDAFNVLNCPCCGDEVKKPMAEHLDECLSFFDNNTTVPEEGASTSFANNTIVIDDDDDDIFDETQTMNATGTKTPCPCCLEMVESEDMNNHLDICLS